MSNQKTHTLGGVPRQQFRPNVSASRNKKQSAGGTFDRLLLAEEPPSCDSLHVRLPACDGSAAGAATACASRPAASDGYGKSREAGVDTSLRATSLRATQQWVKMDAEVQPSRSPSATHCSELSELDHSWLLEPDAPLALPLRPIPVGVGVGGSSRAASRATPRPPSRATPSSRPASRTAAPPPPMLVSQDGAGDGSFPGHSAARALFGTSGSGLTATPDEDDSEALLSLAPSSSSSGLSPLFFFQLPTRLPLKESAPLHGLHGLDPTNVMTGPEYLAALAGCGGGAPVAKIPRTPPDAGDQVCPTPRARP